ncbi:hypothetical protein pipiens_016818 [Culex pipiens pipiens]|uniref:Uncharacterized protein n=1 Tax=Culex pipiens pipiens TaxID=38569 RepID=A0ABD1CJL3_CULPP
MELGGTWLHQKKAHLKHFHRKNRSTSSFLAFCTIRTTHGDQNRDKVAPNCSGSGVTPYSTRIRHNSTPRSAAKFPPAVSTGTVLFDFRRNSQWTSGTTPDKTEDSSVARQWYRRRDPIYQDIVSSLNRRIREECNQANFNKFKDTLRTLHDDRDTLWRITKALRKTTKYSPPLRKGTNIIASSSEKAKLLAASFASAHTNQMPDDPVTVAEVNNSIDAIDRTPLADNHSWGQKFFEQQCLTVCCHVQGQFANAVVVVATD